MGVPVPSTMSDVWACACVDAEATISSAAKAEAARVGRIPDSMVEWRARGGWGFAGAELRFGNAIRKCGQLAT